MKRLILVFCVSLLQNISAQIPNADFENWTSGNPVYWQTTNIPIVPASVMINSDAHSGLFSVKGSVVSDNHNRPFQPYLGNCGPSAQGFPVAQASTILTGWCKLLLNANDRFTGNLKMYNQHQEVIAEGFVYIDSTIETWTQFSLVIEYNTQQTPSTCSLFFTVTDSTMSSSGHIGSFFILDDLNLSGTVGIDEMGNVAEVSTYPNPANDVLNIKFHNGANNSLLLFDAAGKKVIEKTKCNNEESIQIEKLQPGIYFLNAFVDQRKIVKKIVIQ